MACSSQIHSAVPALAMLVVFAVLCVACTQTVPSSLDATIDNHTVPVVRDIWSTGCDAGKYALYLDANATGSYDCVPLPNCSADADCARFTIERLPPRVGVCEQGRCATYCGSGQLFACR